MCTDEHGWYIVIDGDECIIYAREYRTRGQRNAVETAVAQRLVAGTWYARAATFEAALADARLKVLRKKGYYDAGSDETSG
jgi:hypothetical protein